MTCCLKFQHDVMRYSCVIDCSSFNNDILKDLCLTFLLFAAGAKEYGSSPKSTKLLMRENIDCNIIN